MSRRRSLESIETAQFVSIGELARLTNCRYSTLKFYTEEGLLPFLQEGENLTRRFPREEAAAALEKILELRRTGCRMDEIKARLFIADYTDSI